MVDATVNTYEEVVKVNSLYLCLPWQILLRKSYERIWHQTFLFLCLSWLHPLLPEKCIRPKISKYDTDFRTEKTR